MPISHPPGQTSEDYLSATYFLDHDSPAVSHFAVEGSLHMEYVRDRGTFSDIPFELINSTWAAQRKETAGFLDKKLDGDFGEDGARERAGTER
jgi:hypothetical protein